MKPTLANLRKLAHSMGATVETEKWSSFGKTYHRVFVDLNIVGKHFAEADTMLDDIAVDDHKLADCYASLIAQLQLGLVDCPHGTCDECDRD